MPPTRPQHARVEPLLLRRQLADQFHRPSGYCFLGCFWKPIFKAIGNFFRDNWRAILQIAVTVACNLATAGGPACAALGSFVAGITSGDLGQALRGAAIAFATAFAFKVVGDLTSNFDGVLNPKLGGHGPLLPGSDAHLFNIAGHGSSAARQQLLSAANAAQVPCPRQSVPSQHPS
jgi:hypothetical protein